MEGAKLLTYAKEGLGNQDHSRTLWRTTGNYSIKDGSLRETQNTKDNYGHLRLYQPYEHRELPSELAKLRGGEEERVIEFARTYGLLGYHRLAVLDKKEPECSGEPVSWIMAHAETVYLCMELIDGFRGTKKGLERVLIDLAHHRGNQSPVIQAAVAIRSAVERKCWTLGPQALGTVREVAAILLAYVLNRNTVGLAQRVLYDEDANAWFCNFKYSALIEVVYWHLTQILTSDRNLKHCEECNYLFVQEDGRERFCPSPNGKSVCGARNRQRQCRKNRR